MTDGKRKIYCVSKVYTFFFADTLDYSLEFTL